MLEQRREAMEARGAAGLEAAKARAPSVGRFRAYAAMTTSADTARRARCVAESSAQKLSQPEFTLMAVKALRPSEKFQTPPLDGLRLLQNSFYY